MKSLLFCGKVKNKYIDRDFNLKCVGMNTGNLLFWYALSNILDVDTYTQAECKTGTIELNKYASFITTDLIWLRPNCTYDHVWSQLEMANDRPLIPISVGLQNWSYDNEFIMHPDTVKLLQAIQERCVLGVRGNYTAEVLTKYGITNIDVIGCPSLYLPFDYNFSIKKQTIHPKRVSVNMRSLYSELNEHEMAFLKYAKEHTYDFCEQTGHAFSLSICKEIELFEELNNWMNLHKMMFFDVEDWRSYAATQNFSMGGRFHGNVISLWEGIPALFFTVDTRTSEMCDFFGLPAMRMEDFDPMKDVEYYYEKADYTDFNKKYAKNLDHFICFLKKNNLAIVKRIDDWYDKKIGTLENQLSILLAKKRKRSTKRPCGFLS